MNFVPLIVIATACYCRLAGANHVTLERNNGTGLTESVNELTVMSRGQTGTLGVDVSTLISAENFECLKQKGYQHAIIRAYRSVGVVDRNSVATVSNAWAAGFASVDVYLFPCFQCGYPKSQVRAMVDYLGSSRYGMIWIDVEENDWSSDVAANQNFFTDMLEEARTWKPTGVYTSRNHWSGIMGVGYTGGASSSLWYSHYETPLNPSFSDFKPFGGWSEPSIKQFQGTSYMCGVSFDKNWYPE